MTGHGGKVVRLEWVVGHSDGTPSLGLRVGLPGRLHVGEMRGAILVVAVL